MDDSVFHRLYEQYHQDVFNFLGRAALGQLAADGVGRRTLGLRSIRITLQWKPGPDAGARRLPERAEAPRARLVRDPRRRQRLRLAAGRAAHAGRPHRSTARSSPTCCATTRRSTTSRSGTTRTTARSGRRSSTPDGASVAPADYEALLADLLRRRARGPQERERDRGRRLEDAPTRRAPSRSPGIRPPPGSPSSPPPTRRAGRTKPIFDTLGYVAASDQLRGAAVDEASRLLRDLARRLPDADVRARHRLPRHRRSPCPARARRRIWYLAQGYQTAPDPGRTGFTGTETDPNPVPSWSPQEAADQGAGPGVDQAVQLEDAIRVAYCQPAVGAYFNFHLYDERDLAGWQSGVFWPDGAAEGRLPGPRRTSPLRSTHDSIDCAAFSSTASRRGRPR